MFHNWKMASLIVAVLTLGVTVADAKIYRGSEDVYLPGVDYYGCISWDYDLMGEGVAKYVYNTKTCRLSITIRGYADNESGKKACFDNNSDCYDLEIWDYYGGSIQKLCYCVSKNGKVTGCILIKDCDMQNGPV